jgi:hypothetical protein
MTHVVLLLAVSMWKAIRAVSSGSDLVGQPPKQLCFPEREREIYIYT